jgi:hypothetical protein
MSKVDSKSPKDCLSTTAKENKTSDVGGPPPKKRFKASKEITVRLVPILATPKDLDFKLPVLKEPESLTRLRLEYQKAVEAYKKESHAALGIYFICYLSSFFFISFF